jgi:hypothetical protein
MNNLTSLEFAVLAVFHDKYRPLGFPPPDLITVGTRNNTGVGRFVTLITDMKLNLENGYLDMGGHFKWFDGCGTHRKFIPRTVRACGIWE